jgi:AcrR family transcriptional regulator
MNDRRSAPISSRRKPKQARSADLVAAILQAAVQVLAKEGAHRFTTTRVAERAGVSVGSVYQYFPNKASILFRLQSDEWRQTTRCCGGILENTRSRRSSGCARWCTPSSAPSATRPKCAARSRCRAASTATRPRRRKSGRRRRRTVQAFMREALPQASRPVRALAGDLITTTLGAVGKSFPKARAPMRRSRPMPTRWPTCSARTWNALHRAEPATAAVQRLRLLPTQCPRGCRGSCLRCP